METGKWKIETRKSKMDTSKRKIETRKSKMAQHTEDCEFQVTGSHLVPVF
jgi:hypothetical protein